MNDTEGNEVWYHTTFVPCFDDDGRVEHVVATSVNITDRKQMQMQSTQDRYRMLVDLASDSIVLVDPETCGFVEFNRNAHERLGYTRIKFENITMSDIEAIETEDEVAAHIAAVVHRGNDEFQTKHRSSDGKVHDVHVKTATISIGGKTLLLSTWNDINVNDNGD
ncbi:MAG TPA: PAS domain S-box protein [Planctomycetes bacterium]|nr:PAS domain S-box protein [Fuerstiella sp.]HIK92894.1 PAS domain S-box protein [Planctomycetota bacterium]